MTFNAVYGSVPLVEHPKPLQAKDLTPSVPGVPVPPRVLKLYIRNQKKKDTY